MRTTESNIIKTTGNCQASNIIYGFDKYENNTDQSITRISLNSSKGSIVDELDGYTLISNNIAVKGHNDAESRMDFTGLGTSVGVVSFGEVIPELNKTYFRKEVFVEGVKTGETDHMVLGAEQDFECLLETLKFYGMSEL